MSDEVPVAGGSEPIDGLEGLPPPPAAPAAMPSRARAMGDKVGGHADRVLRPTMGVASVGVAAVASPIIATGIVAVVGAGLVLRDTPVVALVAALVGLATIVVPAYVVRNVWKIARAVGEPTVLARQASDLATQARTSPELTQLARHARRSQRVARRRGGKLGKAFGLGRLVAGALDAAQPDPKRHDRLAPLTPVQLRQTWLATLASLWLWAAAAVVVIAEVTTGLLALAT